MYAIVKTGGKQYRVQEGRWLLVERLPAAQGDRVQLPPLLYVNGAELIDGSEIGRVSVTATVLGHERGPKLRIVKFKPKRGYKRRNGHRQELTRIMVTDITAAGSAGAASAAAGSAPEPADGEGPPPAAQAPIRISTLEDSDGANEGTRFLAQRP